MAFGRVVRQVRRCSTIAVVAMIAVAMEVGCTFAPRPATPVPAGGPVSGAATSSEARSIEQRVAAIKAAADRSDHEPESKVRADLANEADSNADACLAVDPGAAACQYGKAVATGLEARVHPARAGGLLAGMLENLRKAEATDPNYDKA